MTGWEVGTTGWCGGIMWRVMQGKKGLNDRRLDFRINGEWVSVQMELGMLMADFFFENEETLYPRAAGAEGGFYYLNALSRAALGDGWEVEAERLKAQKLRRNGVR